MLYTGTKQQDTARFLFPSLGKYSLFSMEPIGGEQHYQFSSGHREHYFFPILQLLPLFTLMILRKTITGKLPVAWLQRVDSIWDPALLNTVFFSRVRRESLFL